MVIAQLKEKLFALENMNKKMKVNIEKKNTGNL